MVLVGNINNQSLSGVELKKYIQKKQILQLLYQNNVLSGPEIGKHLGISFPTALILINELIDAQLVEVRGTGVSKGGRKPVLYGLFKNSVFVIVCELERYRGKLTIYNGNNQQVTPVVFFDSHINDPELTDKVYKNAIDLITQNNLDDEKILGVGLTMPGLVDEEKGINFTIKDERFRNVKQRLEEKFAKLVYINNDAKIQAYGEYLFGEAKGHRNAAIVSWSWGIGLGMVLNGSLYNGSNGFAGEFSHIKMVENGDLCICGKNGCLETLASANVLLNNARAGIRKGKISQLTAKFSENPDLLQPEHIIQTARAGDEFSISLLNQVGYALGKGISMIIQLLNPDIIVIGGPISEAGHFVLVPVQQALHKFSLEQIYRNTHIVISKNWKQTGLLGIAAVLFEKLFSENPI